MYNYCTGNFGAFYFINDISRNSSNNSTAAEWVRARKKRINQKNNRKATTAKRTTHTHTHLFRGKCVKTEICTLVHIFWANNDGQQQKQQLSFAIYFLLTQRESVCFCAKYSINERENANNFVYGLAQRERERQPTTKTNCYSKLRKTCTEFISYGFFWKSEYEAKG